MPVQRTWRRTLSLCSRILAALIGGYVFTNALSLLLFFLLLDRQALQHNSDGVNLALIESVFNGMSLIGLVCFLLYAAAAIWVFYCSSARRAWLGMLLPSAMSVLLIYAMLPPPMRELLSL